MNKKPHKNTGSFLAFSEEWFAAHQKPLLWLLNARLTKRAFRYLMAIREHDIALKDKVDQIAPNRIVYNRHLRYDPIKQELRQHETAAFRTHPKYAKRIYFSFKYVWWTLHAWDWLFADRYAPGLSLGFSTLTAFPDPNPETTTVDGGVLRSAVDETYATIRAGAGNSALPSGNPVQVWLEANSTLNHYDELGRAITLFATSSIGSGSTISSATFSARLVTKANALGSLDIRLVTSTPASNTDLVNADFSQLGTVAQATDVTYASVNTSIYTDFALNATGIGNISKTGITKFGLRLAIDADNSTTGLTWLLGQLSGYEVRMAEQAGTSNDPQLVVNYSTSASYSQTLTETITLTATLKKTAARILTQTITLTASVIRGTIRKLTQTITLTATFARGRTFTQTITMSASMVRAMSHTMTQTITLTATALKTLSHTFSQTITLTATNLRTFGKQLTETITLSASLLRTMRKTLTQTVTMTASLLKTLSHTFTQTLTLTATNLRTPIKRLTETITVSPTLIRALSKVFTQTITLTATLIVLKFYNRTFTQTITLTATFRKTTVKILRETISLTAKVTMYLNGLAVGVWQKAARASATFTKVARTVASWTKRERPY